MPISVYLRNLCAGMLQFLNISNIALIDELQVEFEPGLNLLTGETGSGKSIIVDALGVLIGGRFTSDLLKSGAERGSIEGLFVLGPNPGLERLLENAGMNGGSSEELIIRRELSATGRNKIFINNQLATNSLLRELREFLVDIHGQGDQQTLFNPHTHLELLDSFAISNGLRDEVAEAHQQWVTLQRELDALRRDDAEKFQLLDTLKFQIDELERTQLVIGEDERLEEERRRLANVEKLTALSQSSYERIYEDDDAALARVRQTLKDVTELAEYESSFSEYLEGLESARAVLEDLSFSLRDFVDKLEFSPARLAQIEDRAAELSRLKRKYGGSLESALEHLARSQDRLRQIETSDERDKELAAELDAARSIYFDHAGKLHRERVRAAKRFEKSVEKCIAELAMEHARFQIQVSDAVESPKGIDHIEFYFSANVGEDLKPLARVASGGEASRLMLVLKTVANATEFPRTIVFDEIDSGIGGRVSEAVGIKLRKLAQTNQVLCVTHQPQIARFA
ncbi:MAG TPA: DNA repair protein RecN, partial [Pyrinomonadaceae bacterium]|nr:DNA repair protein RecN [Pyrinomonadaceae bacterium]